MVKNVAGCKLAEGKEPRAADEFAFVPGDPSANRQRREVVSRQEPLACQVTIRVEIAFLPTRTDLQQQVPLTQGLLLPRADAIAWSSGRRARIRAFWASTNWRSAARYSSRHRSNARSNCCGASSSTRSIHVSLNQPLCSSRPASGARIVRTCSSQFMPCRLGKLNCPGGLGFERQIVQLGVDHLLDGLPKRQTHLGKPDGMHMGPQQGFVGQVEAWRPDAARNHVLAAVEEVLVVAIQCAAVREHQPRLPLRPARPLRCA